MAEIVGWFSLKGGAHIPIMKGQSKSEAAKAYMNSKHGKTVARLSSKTYTKKKETNESSIKNILKNNDNYDIEDGVKMLNHNKITEAVMDKLGFSDKPTIVNKLDPNLETLYRGYHGEKAQDYIKQFKEGNNYIPSTLMGKGTFADPDIKGALKYADNNKSNIITMQLSKKTKIIDYDKVNNEFKQYKNSHTVKDFNNFVDKQFYRYISSDITNFSLLKGYDVIKLNDNNYMILNRSKLNVLK